MPTTPQEISDRASELTFNASLLAQMRDIALINRLLANGRMAGSSAKTVLMHRIGGGDELLEFAASTKKSADPALIDRLFEAGRQAAGLWLARHVADLGQRSTVNIARDYLDDTRLTGGPAPPAMPQARPAGPARRGLRWLLDSLLLRRKPPA